MRNNFMPNPIPSPFPQKPDPLLKELVRIVFKGIGNLTGRIGRAICELFKPNPKDRDQKPLNEQKSSADDIAQIHQLLADYRSEANHAAAELIKGIKEDCNSFFEKIISQFEHYSKEFGMDHMTGTYKKRFSGTIDDLDDIFDRCLSKKFSLDDSECISILKMMPGESKANRMAEFKKSVFSKAIDEICKSVEKSIEEFFDTVDDTFMVKINSIAASIEEKTNAFQVMTNEREKSDSEIQLTQLNSIETLTYANIALDLLEGSVG